MSGRATTPLVPPFVPPLHRLGTELFCMEATTIMPSDANKPVEEMRPGRQGRSMLRQLRIATLAAALAAGPALAQTYRVSLQDADGARTPIGVLTLSGSGNARSARFEPDAQRFGERFLAMRPFRCLDGPKWSYCHFPQVTARRGEDDLADIEYALMFMRKPRASVSLDPSQGLYYRLAPNGAGGWSGRLHEADMAPFVDPAAARDRSRPLKPADLHAVDAARAWMPVLLIEP
jgi:hypothetical protein